jgi:hypothetical protein
MARIALLLCLALALLEGGCSSARPRATADPNTLSGALEAAALEPAGGEGPGGGRSWFAEHPTLATALVSAGLVSLALGGALIFAAATMGPIG